MLRHFSRLQIVTLVLVAGGVARADDGAAAARLFTQGRQLIDDGDYAAACPKLAQSAKLAPKIATKITLAGCWEHLGRTASAWNEWREVASLAEKAGDSEWQREAYALERTRALEKKLVRITITVAQKTPGLVVWQDNIPVPEAQLGVPAPVDPGQHVISASANGFAPWSQTVKIGAEPVTAVAVPALEKAAPEPPKGPPLPVS